MPDPGFNQAEFDAYKAAQPAKVASNEDQFDPAEFSAFKQSAAQPKGPLSWSDVGAQALQNTPGSAAQFGHDIVQPFLHPIDTATNLKNLGLGVLQKTGIVSGDEHEKYADAVGRFFADRYGGVENVKRSLATDPVGVAGDLS